jgi:SRSO17 transposase
MVQVQSEKKIFQNFKKTRLSGSYINACMKGYNHHFYVYRRDNSQTANNYIGGLFCCEKGKANMERMVEEVEGSNYNAYHHFLTNSKWSAGNLIAQIAHDASDVLAENKKHGKVPTGYIIDESSHLKKGTKSVGAARQYAGIIGKADNCQVAVYSSLVNDNRATTINEKLFLPESWTKDKGRCDRAKVPQEAQVYKTKPVLALEMIDQDVRAGVQFDWIGGDGLYGHNAQLTKGLDERDLFYVLDVHKDELVFTQGPHIFKPGKTKGRGRPAKNLKAVGEPIRLDKYKEGLNGKDWKKVKVRKTAKGWKKVFVHKADVWSWDGKEEKARRRTLVITKTADKKPKIKYSFSNGRLDEYTHQEYAYFQAQRYWVERTFDDCKNELGMSDYQIRDWVAWHHHQSLVMLASIFLLREKIESKSDYPLMSTRDARILIVIELFGTKEQYQLRLGQMEARHEQRERDIRRYYREDELWE